jgi:hypothetical protein
MPPRARQTTWSLQPGDILKIDGRENPVIFLGFDRRNDIFIYKEPFGAQIEANAAAVRYTVLFRAEEHDHGTV